MELVNNALADVLQRNAARRDGKVAGYIPGPASAIPTTSAFAFRTRAPLKA